MQKSANSTPKFLLFKVVMLDTRYRQVDYFHFRKFNSWFKKLMFEVNNIENNHQALDCDNFAMLYKSLMGVCI